MENGLSKKPVTTDYITNLVNSSKVKSCVLDPVPACVFTGCLPLLLPVITKLVDCSLDTAVMPHVLKKAVITPLLKKANLDSEEFKNYRPVSSLAFISKLIEKVIAVRLVEYMDANNLGEPFQSSGRSRGGARWAPRLLF